MARAESRKKKFVVKIEIGAKGLLATGVVIFCVLLWMFLLGIWAGDHLAGTGGAPEPAPAPVPFPAPAGEQDRGGAVALPQVDLPSAPPPAARAERPEEPGKKNVVRERVTLVPRAEKKKVRRNEKKRAASAPAAGRKEKTATVSGSFFSLQVGAYRDKANAVEDCARLVARGLDAFYREPARGSGYTRVYIGRYAGMDEARAAAARLEKEKGIKSFVVMIPGRGAGK